MCNKKNILLMDALRAQSESRGQHEAFHNLLDRSPEPFSVVAEHFGRGLFNKLLIVEEEDGRTEVGSRSRSREENPGDVRLKRIRLKVEICINFP